MSELRGMYDQPGVPDVQSGVALGADGPPDFPARREPQPVDREALGEWLYVNLSSRRGADSAPWSARKAETHEYWFKRADAVLAFIGGSHDPQA